MRVVDREQAKVVAGFSSTTRVNTRLLALNRAGLLRRFFLGGPGNSRKALYSLSARGAAAVAVQPQGPRRSNDQVLVVDNFVSHQLGINSLYCALKYGPTPGLCVLCVRWISFYKRLSNHLSLIPDGYVELKTPAGTMAAFVEVDSAGASPNIWREKTKKYIELALSGDCERQFGQSRFRVLVVTNVERRLRSIQKVVRAFTQKIFWFANFDAVREKSLFEPIWLRPDGDQVHALFATDNPQP